MRKDANGLCHIPPTDDTFLCKSCTIKQVTVMAYFHQRRRRRIPKRIPNPIDTLYYAQLFPLIQRWRRRLFPSITVPILGTDLHPRDRSPSLFNTFESGDWNLSPYQWKNLHSTRIRLGIRLHLRWWK